MGSFSPLNWYAFAAVGGQFLRPDVRALLESASVGPFSNFANPHDLALRREAEAVRSRLDALLFSEGLPRTTEAKGSTVPVLVRRGP